MNPRFNSQVSGGDSLFIIMARPERKTVDYFPHYISDGKKMFYIEQKYGNDGYATWFKILESLASTEDHFLNLNSEMDIMFLSARCRVEKGVLISILNDLCELKEIDHFLWLNKIVYCPKFIESIHDAYFRRSNKCMTYDSFCKHYAGLCTTITQLSFKKKYNNTQTKVNYTKPKETKEDIIDHFEIFWNKYPNKTGKKPAKEKFERLTDLEIETILKTIDTFAAYKPFKDYNHPHATTYLNQRRWEDVIPAPEKKEHNITQDVWHIAKRIPEQKSKLCAQFNLTAEQFDNLYK